MIAQKKSNTRHDSVGKIIHWEIEIWPYYQMVYAQSRIHTWEEFVLQSRYYVHFRASTLEKGMNPLILLAMG